MALVDPNIAMSFRAPEIKPRNTLAEYAQLQQLMTGQQTQELNRLQVQEYERAREEEQSIRNRLAGGASLDDASTRNFLLGSKTGRDILQRQSDLLKAQTEDAARRAKLMQDTEAMYRNMATQIGNKADAANFLQRMLNDPALKDAPITRIPLMEQVRHIPDDPQGLDNWIKKFALGATKWVTENKPTTQVINQGGQSQVIQTPGLGGAPTTIGTYADVPLPAAVEAQQGRLRRAGAPVTNLSVNTGRKFGETFATQIAERDANMLDAARQAPTLAADANRIIDLANNSSVFTGSLAQVKLNVARALGVAGADTNEVVANTEQLIAAAGQSTLNAIKSAGLGTGQGFTDKDLAFLRDIAGGKITFTKETLSELARLQYKVAEKAAGAWGARVKEIPKEALEGTGISTAPITLPPLSRPGGPPKTVGQIPGQAPAAKTVVRTGTLDGRKVVQYSDGTTGYAD